jgi:glycosyltransferase involved in cell wall biosynthesis
MRCGVGDYTAQLAHALTGLAGVEVGLLTSREAAPERLPDSIRLFAAVEKWGFRDILRIRSVLRQWRPDLVHIQFPTQGYGRSHLPTLLPLLCRLWGFHVVQTWHESRERVTVGGLFWLASQVPVRGGVIFVRPQFEQMLAPLLRRSLLNKLARFIPNASALRPACLSPAERAVIRAKFARPGTLLVTYFGFIYPGKGVELLFRVADPENQHLVIIGAPVAAEPEDYYRQIVETANAPPWSGKATLAGFLPADEVADVIAASDAVVLPFMSGGGEWNTSIHGAQAQGTFVLTTSTERRGFDAATNTFFARPGDIDEMRVALKQYTGHRESSREDGMTSSWEAIAKAHRALYAELSGEGN